jgi:hypothetical protein
MATWLGITIGLAIALVCFFVALALADRDAIPGRKRRRPLSHR